MEHIAALCCIVPAAGLGSRFHSPTPKQYLEVAGRPLLAHSLERLRQALDRMDMLSRSQIIVAVHPEYPLPTECYIEGLQISTVIGGHTRQQSVWLALQALLAEPSRFGADIDDDGKGCWVMIHDGDRPCVDPDDIAALLRRCRGYDGGFLCYPLTDSLVSVRSHTEDENAMTCSPRSRHDYRLSATPQAFRLDCISKAHRLAVDNNWTVYDDASIVMRAGYRLLAMDSSVQNIKMTFDHDLAGIEHILNSSTFSS